MRGGSSDAARLLLDWSSTAHAAKLGAAPKAAANRATSSPKPGMTGITSTPSRAKRAHDKARPTRLRARQFGSRCLASSHAALNRAVIAQGAARMGTINASTTMRATELASATSRARRQQRAVRRPFGQGSAGNSAV